MEKRHPTQPFGMSQQRGEAEETQISSDVTRAERRRVPPSVKVLIVRPDDTTREVTASGFFREEYLCALLDEELVKLPSKETLTVHLFHPDEALVQSLRDRWREGLSDNRRVRIREVLGPNDDPEELKVQLKRLEVRLKQGEKIHLAIRSPRVARFASAPLRRILLQSQRGQLSPLKVSVYGSEEIQRAIMEHMEGMVRAQDYERLVDAGMVAPITSEMPKFGNRRRRKHKKHKKHLTPQQAVNTWIRKVEKTRDSASSD